MTLETMLKQYFDTVHGDYRRYPENHSDIDMIYDIEEHIATPSGRTELSLLSEEQQVKLWNIAVNHRRFRPFSEFCYRSFRRRPSSSDLNEEIDRNGYSILIINRILDVLPNSLMLPSGESFGNGCFEMDAPVILYILMCYGDELPNILTFRMIDMNPGGVVTQKQDAFGGNTLLHLVSDCEEVPHDIIQKIDYTFPNAATYKNYKGETPLHVAANALIFSFEGLFEKKLKIFEFIFCMYPAAATVIDNEGHSPISCVILGWLDTMFNCNLLPDDDDFGEFAKGMVRSLFMLQRAYPDFARLPILQTPSPKNGSLRQTPLLYIIKEPLLMDHPILLLYIIHASSQGIFKQDVDGYTPLEHLLDQKTMVLDLFAYIKKGQSKKTFQDFNDMINTFQNMRDNITGENILHVLSKVKAAYPEKKIISDTDEVDQCLIRKLMCKEFIGLYPAFTMDVDRMGDSPFHVRLVQQHGNEFLLDEIQVMADVMTTIAQARHEPNPSVTMHDGLQMYPFMMAASKTNPCLSTTYFLLQKFIVSHGSLNNLWYEE